MATLRKINNINTSELIDEGIIIWFPGPQSYTGEDMVEIHIHGGKAIVIALQNEISKIENFRLAEPGEFTKIALVIFMAKYFHKLNAEKTIGLFKSILPLIVSIIFFLLSLREVPSDLTFSSRRFSLWFFSLIIN